MKKFTEDIAHRLLTAFTGENWTDVSIQTTLSGINYQQAKQVTPASPNSIASLVHHLAYWNHIILERMNGHDPAIPAINGFDVPSINSEADWKNIIENTHTSFIQLSEAIQRFPENELSAKTQSGNSTILSTLQGIVEHAYYHLGQIVILSHIVKKNS